MSTTDILLAIAAASLALASRSLMKRSLMRWTGKVVASLLEVDFWKAASRRPMTRALLLVELASWALTVSMVLKVAEEVLGL
jgi:hypothetical protein